MKKLVLALLLFGAVFLGVRYYKQTYVSKIVNGSPIDSVKTFAIIEIEVVKGHVFHMDLPNKGWIKTRLEVATLEDAREKVLELLNTSEYPIVTLKHKDGDYWVVSLNLVHNGDRIDLVEWLDSNNLIFR